MSAVWNDTVLVEAFDSAILKYQMREGISKRKLAESQTIEKGGEQGTDDDSFQKWKEAVVSQQRASTTSIGVESLCSESSQICAEEQDRLPGLNHESLPKAKMNQKSWQQKLEELEEQQEQFLKQLYLVGSFILGSVGRMQYFPRDDFELVTTSGSKTSSDSTELQLNDR